jgi:hypothetical protein
VSRTSPAGVPLLSAAIVLLQRKFLPQKQNAPERIEGVSIVQLQYF